MKINKLGLLLIIFLLPVAVRAQEVFPSTLEILNGDVTVYQYKKDSKSRPIDFRIKIPNSWKSMPGDRDGVTQIFTTDHLLSTPCQIILMINDLGLPKGQVLNNAQIKSYFSEDRMIHLIPEEGKLVSFQGNIGISGNYGIMLEYDTIIRQIDTDINLRSVNFSFIKNNNLYLLKCNIALNDVKTTDLTNLTNSFKDFAKLIANSIVCDL